MSTATITSTRRRVATIQARPQPVPVDTAACAVLVIDMQNDFGSEGGMFHRAGIDISMIQRAVDPTRRVLAAARRNGVPVIYQSQSVTPVPRSLQDAQALPRRSARGASRGD
jgi:nicotinamidase-related amidase